MLHDIWMRSRHRRTQELELRQIIDHVVQVADPGIRTADQYYKILQSPIKRAKEYCTALIETIPGPVVLSRSEYNSDSPIQFLFSSADELDAVLRSSEELKTLAKQEYIGEVTALLTVTRKEQTVFRYEREGNMLLGNVARQAVSFYDHEIVSPAATIDKAKQQLVERGINALATIAKNDIAGLKANKAELREEKEYLNAMLRLIGGKKGMFEQLFSPPNPTKMLEIAKVKERLAETESELAVAQKQLDSPEDALTYLITLMSCPEEELTLKHYTLRLDWNRVRLDEKDDVKGNEIRLAELSTRNDELQRSAVMVTFTFPVPPPGSGK